MPKAIRKHMTADLHQPIVQGCAQALLYVGNHNGESLTTNQILKAATRRIENKDAVYWIRWFLRDHLTSDLVNYAQVQTDNWSTLWYFIATLLKDQGFPFSLPPWPDLEIVSE